MLKIVTASAVLLAAGMLAAPASSEEPSATCNGLAVTVPATGGPDHLVGTAGDDVVSLGGGNDSFDGRGGNDTICGGSGVDDLDGGPGDDWIDGGADRDSLTDDQRFGVEPAGIDGADTLLGGDGDDDLEVLSGDGEGGGGADTVDGGAGTDNLSYELSPVGIRLDLAAGTVRGGGGTIDTIAGIEGMVKGTDRSDVMLGTDGPDQFHSVDVHGPGSDTIRTFGGDDFVSAQRGTIDTGTGNDRYEPLEAVTHDLEVDLGRGADTAIISDGSTTTYRMGPGPDVMSVSDDEFGHDYSGLDARALGGRGVDLLTFAGHHRGIELDAAAHRATFGSSVLRFRNVDEFQGSAYADVLLGSDEADRMFGYRGRDLLRGRAGRDLLVGNRGKDTADGGRGRDTCRAERRISCERR